MIDRSVHVDVSKGISIALVALAHSKLQLYFPLAFESLGLLRLPLFFFLSGIFFNGAEIFSTFFKKKFNSLLKPYLVTLFVLLFLDFIFSGRIGALSIFGVVYGVGHTIKWMPLWFLPHLFLLYCFSYLLFYVFNLNNKSLLYRLFFLFFLFFVGSFFIRVFKNFNVLIGSENIFLGGLPLSLDVVLLSSGFFILGSFFKFHVVNFKPHVFAFLFSIIVFIVIAINTEAKIDFNFRAYDSPVFSTIGAFSGIYIAIFSSFYLSKVFFVEKILVYLGRSSLFILIFHQFIILKSYALLSALAGREDSLFIAVITYFFGLVLPLLIKIVVNRSKILTSLFL